MIKMADSFLPDAILFVIYTSILQTTLVMHKFMSMKPTLEQTAIVFKLMNISYSIVFNNYTKNIYSVIVRTILRSNLIMSIISQHH